MKAPAGGLVLVIDCYKHVTLMKLNRCSSIMAAWFLVLLISIFSASAPAQPNVLISEFMANDTHTLAGEDGQFSDWIEIHNAGATVVNLNGWYLTDSATTLTKWSFPATNLAANGYMVVFASGKNRQIPGAPLHTNFKLGSSGGYLGLVQPDGVTVASSYAPKYPIQVPDVSYGIPNQQLVTTLVASGAVAKVLVPTDGSLGTTWTAPGFNDSGWNTMATGIGYETDVQTNFTAVQIADSGLGVLCVQGSH